MAYYNAGFPATYQPVYQYQQPVQQNQQTGLNWIQGEQAAKSYLVAPNSTVVLFDSESQVIYLKSADASGMPSIKVLDYTIRETGRNAPVSPVDTSSDKCAEYATKSEIDGVLKQIKALRERLNKIAKEDEEDE